MAIAILAGLRAEGLSAPADVAVIGVDDVPAARFTVPPLTTVSQSLAVQARHLAGMVVAGLEGGAGLPGGAGSDGGAGLLGGATPPPLGETLDVVVRESA